MPREYMSFMRAEKSAVYFLILSMAVAVLLALLIFLPSADIIIKTASQPAALDITIALDPSLTQIPPTIAAVPAKLAAVNELPLNAGNEWVIDERLMIDAATGQGYIIYKQNDIQTIINRELRLALDEKQELWLKSEPIFIIKEIRVDSKRMNAQLLVRAEGISVPAFPYQNWRLIAKKGRLALMQSITETEGVNSATIRIFPKFWPFLPFIADRLDFALDID